MLGLGLASSDGMNASAREARERRRTGSHTMLTERLSLILDWYGGMISEWTGRLLYTYDPEREVAVAEGSPIRAIASVWDMELLSRFLDRSDLLPLVERSLRHYTGYLVARDGTLVLDPTRLGEPSGIAHSAFMMLALLESDVPGREPKIRALAEGILRQQREDGSYRIYFGDADDEGLEFYPGEAMLALMQAYSFTHEPRYLTSVERGFRYYREQFPANAVAPDLLVFYANWQSQYAARLHSQTQSEELESAIRDYAFALHDQVLLTQFYDEIERHPMRQATVAVACALEGINDAYAIAVREGDTGHARAYAQAIRVALGWLLRAQRIELCTSQERGGFGHSLTVRTQRIDVTGHVAGGLIKTAQNRLD